MRRPKKKKEIKIGKNILQLNSIFRQRDLLTLSKYLLIFKKERNPIRKGDFLIQSCTLCVVPQ